jgi:hypothetical protein
VPAIDLIAGCATSLPLKPLRSPDQNDNLSENQSNRCLGLLTFRLFNPNSAMVVVQSLVAEGL